MSENRAKIIQIALNLFATHGYDAVGVQQIVEQAGVTKPTLYHYFNSKRGLFDALVAAKAAPLLAELERLVVYQGDITQSITCIFRFYFEYARDEPIFYRLMLATWFTPPSSEIHDTISQLQQQQFALIESMFRQAAGQHGNMRGRSQQYAISLRGTIDTYVGLALQEHIQLTTDDLMVKAIHQFMHGIFS